MLGIVGLTQNCIEKLIISDSIISDVDLDFEMKLSLLIKLWLFWHYYLSLATNFSHRKTPVLSSRFMFDVTLTAADVDLSV